MEGGFGGDVDYAQLVKPYGPTITAPGRYSPAECVGARKVRAEGDPDKAHVSTSYVERQNLTILKWRSPRPRSAALTKSAWL